MASIWVVTLHNLLCTWTHPYPVTLLPICSGYFRAEPFPLKIPQLFSNQSFYTYLPMKMEQIECSETSAYKIHTLGNCPEESIQHSENGQSLKWNDYRFAAGYFCMHWRTFLLSNPSHVLYPFWKNANSVSQLSSIINVTKENIQHCRCAHILLASLDSKCDVTFPHW